MGISTDPSLLGVELPSSGGMSLSPSVSTFLPEEDASICPLISTTPSPPLAFSHPLTPSACDNASQSSVNCEDTKAETSSSGSSSGIGMDVNDNDAATTLFNKNAYQHLRKTNENGFQENGHKQNGNITLNQDAPCFVSWNWPLIRKCTFFLFMSSLLAMCAVIVAMIMTIPKTCNPKTAWYRGSVFYEIFPASFQDSNNDGVGDLRGIMTRIEYLENLGIGAVRLNSIFASKHYPDQYENINSLMEIDKIVGTVDHLEQLAYSLHARNMSLILDLPIYPYLKHLEIADNLNSIDDNTTTTTTTFKSILQNPITQAMRHWLRYGVDGFYVKGLEYFQDDPNLIENIIEWKSILGEDRVLILSENFFENLETTVARSIVDHVDLVEVHLNISNGTQNLEKQIRDILTGVFAPKETGIWIQWSLGGLTKKRISHGQTSNATLAATVMQLMLPGSPNIFYGDEISLGDSHDPNNDHMDTKHLHHLASMQWQSGVQFTNRDTLPWLPHGIQATFYNYDYVAKMIKLRDRSPSIYKNAIIRDDTIIPNTNIRHSQDDILLVERIYPRRNSFVSISNFGPKNVEMDLTSLYYSGQAIVGKTRSGKVYFAEFEIGPMETIVVRLDK